MATGELGGVELRLIEHVSLGEPPRSLALVGHGERTLVAALANSQRVVSLRRNPSGGIAKADTAEWPPERQVAVESPSCLLAVCW